ncbi:serine hydrolase domain-containing protein [Robiginitalea sp. SC105]|uniref:serine hydrolase domain-containing protein n=1 Tax=Robiginitalea sp. SC105 TaxID=2762332 RepID=UPI00351C96A6
MAEAAALLQALADGGQVPGLAVRIQYRGTPLLRAAYGYADLENPVPASPGTLFRIASVSKPITATALARLVEAGKLRLEDPLEDYVPEFPQRGIHLEQLAAHTAGLRGYRGKEYALNKPFSIAESLEIFRDDPLVFRPGKGFLYNSFDFVLLSLAMERALGIPFHELVRRYVLEPLGMQDTCMELPGQLRRGQARPYTRGARGFRPSIPVDNRYKLAGGGYLSTVDDICRLGQAYLDRKAVDPVVAREFLTSREISGEPTWYGLGWQVSRDAGGREYYGHVGNAVGGYSNFFVYPERELVVAILINCTDPGLQPMLDTAVEAVHAGIGRVAP